MPLPTSVLPRVSSDCLKQSRLASLSYLAVQPWKDWRRKRRNLFRGRASLGTRFPLSRSGRHKQQKAFLRRLAVVVPERLPAVASRDPSLRSSSHSLALSCALRSLKAHKQAPWIARARPRSRRARRRRTAIASRALALPVALERPRGCRSASSECAPLGTRADRFSPALPLTRPRPHRSPPLRLVPK